MRLPQGEVNMDEIIQELKALVKKYESSLSPNKLDDELQAIIQRLEGKNHKIFVASDLHFGHESVSKFGGSEMQQLILNNLLKGK